MDKGRTIDTDSVLALLLGGDVWKDPDELIEKALVDIEKLREIEWINDPEYDERYCQVCQEFEDDGHTDSCWLGNLLSGC